MEPVNEPTPSRPADFGEAWAELEPQLRRSLASAPAHVVDDVLQETSIKLLRVWGNIDHERPALPLAVTIARNTLRDELRRTARHSHAELSEEARVRDDLDDVVSARLELARVGTEMSRLTPGQRAALLTEVGGGRTSPDSPKVKMLRARARARLRELVAQAGGFVVTRVARLRSSVTGRAAAGVPEMGILAQALLLAVVAAGSGVSIGEDPGRVRPEGVTPAAVAARSVRRMPGGAAGGVAAAVAQRPGAPSPRGETVALPDVDHGGAEASEPRLPSAPLPRARGGAHDEGHFGPEGFAFAGDGGNSTAGHDVGWRYEGEWKSPRCVQKLAEGQAPGRCDAPESPSAAAEVEVDGRRHRVDTDERRR